MVVVCTSGDGINPLWRSKARRSLAALVAAVSRDLDEDGMRLYSAMETPLVDIVMLPAHDARGTAGRCTASTLPAIRKSVSGPMEIGR